MISLFLVVAIISVPSGYYNAPCQMPEGISLYDWLDTIQLPPYEIYKFDCSQRLPISNG